VGETEGSESEAPCSRLCSGPLGTQNFRCNAGALVTVLAVGK
jgi:hypothetical protein